MFNYSIIGLGKLGVCMAAAIASRGFNVVGVDTNQNAIDAINSENFTSKEIGLSDLIASTKDRFYATANCEEAILKSDITFVIVPTPTNENGGFCLEQLESAFGNIGQAIRKKNKYHLVVLTSTVLPGAMRSKLLPILEKESDKKCGADFGLCYSPSFIALGSVIRDFLHPDFALIGEFDENSGEMLKAAYEEIMLSKPECRRMSLENAELTKISINTYVTMKITFANVIADICERLPNGDVDVVTKAMGFDSRIGSKYLKGAVGFGGPCFPRDNRAFSYMAQYLETNAELADTTDRINQQLYLKILNRIQNYITPDTNIAVFGMAYKPFTDVTEGSQGIILAKTLSSQGINVFVHDSLAAISPDLSGENNIEQKSLKECLDRSSIIVITTDDPVYHDLEAKDFLGSQKEVIVVDCWRILSDKLMNQPGILYIPIGRSINDEINRDRLIKFWNASSF